MDTTAICIVKVSQNNWRRGPGLCITVDPEDCETPGDPSGSDSFLLLLRSKSMFEADPGRTSEKRRT